MLQELELSHILKYHHDARQSWLEIGAGTMSANAKLERLQQFSVGVEREAEVKRYDTTVISVPFQE